jgi:hypothetical protein
MQLFSMQGVQGVECTYFVSIMTWLSFLLVMALLLSFLPWLVAFFWLALLFV